MTDTLGVIEVRIAAAEQAYQAAETAYNERHNVRGAYAKLSASLEATQIMVQSDAYRQGLIGAWELLTGRSWTGVRTLYDNEIRYEVARER